MLCTNSLRCSAISCKSTWTGERCVNLSLVCNASQTYLLHSLSRGHWCQVNFFHLDEYIGITTEHPASFGRYLKERLVDKLPCAPKSFHYVSPAGDAEAECKRLNAIIKQHPIDVAFVGIGENGHLAFNDPPADFATTAPYIVVNLDEDCRKQQLGEGWFPNLAAVPKQAISMSIKHIMAVRESVPARYCCP